MASTLTTQKQLEQLSQDILKMCNLTIEMVKKITEAISSNKPHNINPIYELEKTLNKYQIEIDDTCFDMLSKNDLNPESLRFVVAIMKTTAELERIGDQVVNIHDHFSRIQLSRLSDNEAIKNLTSMGEESIRMIESASFALLNKDEKEATWVLSHDDVIDEMKREFYTYSTSRMMESPEKIRAYIDIIFTASNFERIADLATNIAENAIYSIKGKDIRHRRTEL